MPTYNKFGPIVGVTSDIGENGNILKVQYASGRCGYITEKNISCNKSDAILIPSINSITNLQEQIDNIEAGEIPEPVWSNTLSDI